jgi:hypothetical protein
MNAPLVGLLAAIHSEYICPQQWIAWADDQIVKAAKPPMWLIDLSMAKNHREAWRAIAESVEGTTELSLSDLEETALGLIALQYFEGRIGFRDFLLRAGNHTDPSRCSIDCEYFYKHLNRYEAAQDPSRYEIESASGIRTDLKESIELAELARTQIKAITQPDGAANRIQPFGQETNRKSSAAGSGG